jgi:hypothetical protein
VSGSRARRQISGTRAADAGDSCGRGQAQRSCPYWPAEHDRHSSRSAHDPAMECASGNMSRIGGAALRHGRGVVCCDDLSWANVGRSRCKRFRVSILGGWSIVLRAVYYLSCSSEAAARLGASTQPRQLTAEVVWRSSYRETVHCTRWRRSWQLDRGRVRPRGNPSRGAAAIEPGAAALISARRRARAPARRRRPATW